jgi:hypothetical protein
MVKQAELILGLLLLLLLRHPHHSSPLPSLGASSTSWRDGPAKSIGRLLQDAVYAYDDMITWCQYGTARHGTASDYLPTHHTMQCAYMRTDRNPPVFTCSKHSRRVSLASPSLDREPLTLTVLFIDQVFTHDASVPSPPAPCVSLPSYAPTSPLAMYYGSSQSSSLPRYAFMYLLLLLPPPCLVVKSRLS